MIGRHTVTVYPDPKGVGITDIPVSPNTNLVVSPTQIHTTFVDPWMNNPAYGYQPPPYALGAPKGEDDTWPVVTPAPPIGWQPLHPDEAWTRTADANAATNTTYGSPSFTTAGPTGIISDLFPLPLIPLVLTIYAYATFATGSPATTPHTQAVLTARLFNQARNQVFTRDWTTNSTSYGLAFHKFTAEPIAAEDIPQGAAFGQLVMTFSNLSTTVEAWSVEAAYCVMFATVPTEADLSCLTEEVSIHHGRDDTSSQPDAATATITYTPPDDTDNLYPNGDFEQDDTHTWEPVGRYGVAPVITTQYSHSPTHSLAGTATGVDGNSPEAPYVRFARTRLDTFLPRWGSYDLTAWVNVLANIATYVQAGLTITSDEPGFDPILLMTTARSSWDQLETQFDWDGARSLYLNMVQESGNPPAMCIDDIVLRPSAAAAAAVSPGSIVRVTTADSEGNDQTRFVGRVTDVTYSWNDAGAETPNRPTGTLTAAAFLADLSRAVIGDEPWPQESDGARVARILADGGVTLDPYSSDPGSVQILPRDVDAQPALDVAHDTANSAGGIVWHTRAGDVRYADNGHRSAQIPELVLDSCELIVAPQWGLTTDGLINRAFIGYGIDDTGAQPQVTAVNDSSVATYGRYDYSTSTQLASEIDAQSVADLLVGRNARPAWVMSDVGVAVVVLDAAETDALLGLDMHSLIRLENLPGVANAPISALLWVEGWTETLAYQKHDLALTVSDYARSVSPPAWDDVSPDLTWDDVPPNIRWNDVDSPVVLTPEGA